MKIFVDKNIKNKKKRSLLNDEEIIITFDMDIISDNNVHGAFFVLKASDTVRFRASSSGPEFYYLYENEEGRAYT